MLPISMISSPLYKLTQPYPNHKTNITEYNKQYKDSTNYPTIQPYLLLDFIKEIM